MRALPSLPRAMARRASRSVMMPDGFPSVRTTADPTPRSIIHTAASRRLSPSETVSTALVMSESISIRDATSCARGGSACVARTEWSPAAPPAL